jgi:hypothetical protein
VTSLDEGADQIDLPLLLMLLLLCDVWGNHMVGEARWKLLLRWLLHVEHLLWKSTTLLLLLLLLLRELLLLSHHYLLVHVGRKLRAHGAWVTSRCKRRLLLKLLLLLLHSHPLLLLGLSSVGWHSDATCDVELLGLPLGLGLLDLNLCLLLLLGIQHKEGSSTSLLLLLLLLVLVHHRHLLGSKKHHGLLWRHLRKALLRLCGTLIHSVDCRYLLRVEGWSWRRWCSGLGDLLREGSRRLWRRRRRRWGLQLLWHSLTLWAMWLSGERGCLLLGGLLLRRLLLLK